MAKCTVAEAVEILNASINDGKALVIYCDGSSNVYSKEKIKGIKTAKAVNKLIGCKDNDYMIFNKFTLYWDCEGAINGSFRNQLAEALIASDPKNYKFPVYGNVVIFPGGVE